MSTPCHQNLEWGLWKCKKYHRFAEFIKIQGPAWWNWKQGAMTCPNTLNINNSYSRSSLYTTRGLRFIFTSFQLIDYRISEIYRLLQNFTRMLFLEIHNSLSYDFQEFKGAFHWTMERSPHKRGEDDNLVVFYDLNASEICPYKWVAF